MELEPIPWAKRNSLYDDFCRVAVTIVKHNFPSNAHPNSPEASQLIQNIPHNL